MEKGNNDTYNGFTRDLKCYNRVFVNGNNTSEEEKKKYEVDISNKKYIKIFIDNIYFNSNSNAIDLEVVFSSLTKCDNYMDIINLLLGYFSKKQEGVDNNIKKYLVTYKKLAIKLNRCPSIDELNDYFNEGCFCSFSYEKIMDSDELLEQVNYYINYKRAFDYYFSAHFAIVIHYAKLYSKNNQSMEIVDLVNEGCLGLIIAINKYIPSYNNKFSTYATWWINQAICRSILNCDRTIRVPVHIINGYISYYRKKEAALVDLGDNPTYQEIADKLGISVEDVNKYESINYYTIALSLDKRNDESDEPSELIDIVADNGLSNPESVIINKSLSEDIQVLFECLDEREKEILLLRYGFINDKIYTNREIGEIYGITRERVRQIQNDALSKIRRRKEKPKNKSLINYLYH